jgi:protein SCO1
MTGEKKNGRLIGIIVIVIIILAGLGVYSYSKQKTASEQQPNTPAAPENAQNPSTPSSSPTLLPTPKTINNFTLTDDTGKPFTNDNLKNHWTFMFFGFTHCGDVCPNTLAELNKMYQQLEAKLPADQLPQIVFISVDPERDTTDVLHQYVQNFNPHFIAATGNIDSLNPFVQDLGIYYSKVPNEQDPNTYSMDHSSQLYVFNPDGNWAGILTYPQSADELVKSYETMTHAPQQQST